MNRKGLPVGLLLLVAADFRTGVPAQYCRCRPWRCGWGPAHGHHAGTFATLVADASPPELRGTAYGYYNLLTGITMLAASVVAGLLWDSYGPTATFLAGVAFTLLALAGLTALRGDISGMVAERSRKPL
jgi:predicted MFS family arabinose efflux permease